MSLGMKLGNYRIINRSSEERCFISVSSQLPEVVLIKDEDSETNKLLMKVSRNTQTLVLA